MQVKVEWNTGNLEEKGIKLTLWGKSSWLHQIQLLCKLTHNKGDWHLTKYITILVKRIRIPRESNYILKLLTACPEYTLCLEKEAAFFCQTFARSLKKKREADWCKKPIWLPEHTSETTYIEAGIRNGGFYFKNVLKLLICQPLFIKTQTWTRLII